MTSRWQRDEGSITVFMVGITAALMLMAGLVYDGGQVLAARRLAHDLAGNAARAGAQAVDVTALRSGATPVVDPLGAQAAAEDYLTMIGHEGEVSVSEDRVAVTVRLTKRMVLLQLAGIDERTVTATREARLVRGVTGPET